MPRGAKVDRPVTSLLFKNGILLDRRSFVSLNGNEPHLFLAGADIIRLRGWAFTKSKGRCQLRLKGCRGTAEEMHHKQGGLTGRCDCRHNVCMSCSNCHSVEHNRYPKFGPGRAEAIKQFMKLTGGND
jgi:hypothetical protein